MSSSPQSTRSPNNYTPSRPVRSRIPNRSSSCGCAARIYFHPPRTYYFWLLRVGFAMMTCRPGRCGAVRCDLHIDAPSITNLTLLEHLATTIVACCTAPGAVSNRHPSACRDFRAPSLFRSWLGEWRFPPLQIARFQEVGKCNC